MPQNQWNITTLGQYLERKRRDAGLSMRDLAAGTGVPLATINRLLKDEVGKPTPDHLARLADVLGCPVADLYLFAGLPLPGGPPSLEATLQVAYHLPAEAVPEVLSEIEAVIASHRRSQPPP